MLSNRNRQKEILAAMLNIRERAQEVSYKTEADIASLCVEVYGSFLNQNTTELHVLSQENLPTPIIHWASIASCRKRR